MQSEQRAEPAPSRPAWQQVTVLAAVACGGVIGAPARYEIGVLIPTPADGGFPWSTFIINISGALLLGMLYAFLQAHYPTGHLARAFFGTGLLGAYTTFSTYTVETVLLARDGYIGRSALYLIASLVLGVLAAGLGVTIGHRIGTRS